MDSVPQPYPNVYAMSHFISTFKSSCRFILSYSIYQLKSNYKKQKECVTMPLVRIKLIDEYLNLQENFIIIID